MINYVIGLLFALLVSSNDLYVCIRYVVSRYAI